MRSNRMLNCKMSLAGPADGPSKSIAWSAAPAARDATSVNEGAVFAIDAGRDVLICAGRVGQNVAQGPSRLADEAILVGNGPS
jgi:hypothetical protein